jgi:hypothetical protein
MIKTKDSNIGIVSGSSNNSVIYINSNELYCEKNLVRDTKDGSRALYFQEAARIVEDHDIKGIFSSIYVIEEEELKIRSSSDSSEAIFEPYHIGGTDNITSETKADILEKATTFSQHSDKQEDLAYYDSCISKFNLNSSSVTFDVFDPTSDIYTSQISLDSLYNISKVKSEKLTAIADLVLQYSTFTNPKEIINVNTFLEVFNNGERINIVQELDDNINLNYINGQISVVPLNLNVAECIIAKCTITYGKL